MGYLETSGIILRRRDSYSDHQEIILFTPGEGGLSVRAPHARKSQKVYCGRLEPPNLIEARLYRSGEQVTWTLSEANIKTVFADLMREETLRYELWPLLSLYRELFPEQQLPDGCYHRFLKALRLYKSGFEPVELVSTRLLVRTAQSVGIAPSPRCRKCGTDSSDHWCLHFARGFFCKSHEVEDESAKVIRQPVREWYETLLEQSWDRICESTVPLDTVKQLEEIMYRLFHYQLEVSLDTLNVRRKPHPG
ncbi:MAG: DNA repair protein RecO [bacterium]